MIPGDPPASAPDSTGREAAPPTPSPSPEPGAGERDTAADDPSRDHAGRRALARAAVSAVGLSLVLAGVAAVRALASGRVPSRSDLFEPAILGLSVGLVAGPVALVELLFARARAGLVRDLAAGVFAASVGFVGVLLATLQFLYSLTFVQTVSPDRAWQAVHEEAERMLKNERDYATVFGAAALVFGLGTAARLRRPSLLRQTLGLLGGTALLALPLLWTDRRGSMDLREVGLWFVLGACVLPLAANVAEALERRVIANLSGDEPEKRALPPISWWLRLRRSGLPLLLVLVVASGLGWSARRLLKNPRMIFLEESPLAQSLVPRFAAWSASRLTSSEIATLVSSAIVADYHVRPRLAPDDPLSIECHLELAAPPPYSFNTATTWALDGKPLVNGLSRSSTFSFGEGFTAVEDSVAVNAWRPSAGGLALGHHALTGATKLELKNGATVVWSSTRDESLAFDVVAGGDPEAIQLVTPWFSDDSLEVTASPTNTRGPGYWNLDVWVGDATISIAARVDLRDTDGALLGTTPLLIRSGHPQGAELAFLPTPGTHDLTVTITPDPKLALAHTATVHEIYGLPIVRHLTVEAK